MINKIILITLFFLLACSKVSRLKDFYQKSEVNFSKSQVQRFKNYLSGNFYSFELERGIYAKPIMFAISNDGKKSIVVGCEGFDASCDFTGELFQIIKRYEKRTKNKFIIAAIGKKIVYEKSVLKNLKNNKKSVYVNKVSKGEFFDLILLPSDPCAGDDC